MSRGLGHDMMYCGTTTELALMCSVSADQQRSLESNTWIVGGGIFNECFIIYLHGDS